jgi:hypothetical protein
MINTYTQLNSNIGGALRQALDATTKVALDELLKLIEADVYSYPDSWTNGSSGDLGRTGEWKDTWDRTKAVLTGNQVSAEIGQIIEVRWHQPFSHGSIIENEAISNDNLSTIINEGLRDTGINFPAMPTRPFWDDFRKWCDNNLVAVFKAECAKQGVPMSATLTYSM